VARETVSIDVSELMDFARDMVGAAELTKRAKRKYDREAAEAIATEARSEAGRHSTSIPPTIRVHKLAEGNYAVEAGGPDVPLAGLYEYGNKGARTPYFIHPVFSKPGDPEYLDRGSWPHQQRFPFMAPAIRRTVNPLEALGDERVKEILRRYRLA
jgi:hypothetical protein